MLSTGKYVSGGRIVWVELMCAKLFRSVIDGLGESNVGQRRMD